MSQLIHCFPLQLPPPCLVLISATAWGGRRVVDGGKSCGENLELDIREMFLLAAGKCYKAPRKGQFSWITNSFATWYLASLLPLQQCLWELAILSLLNRGLQAATVWQSKDGQSRL